MNEISKNIKFILASASPRRHDLLCSAGIPHEILVTDADEAPTGSPLEGEMFAEFFAREASRLKADAAADMLTPASRERLIIISADTVVSPDGYTVFGKPRDAADAHRMLRTLSGGEHYVIGGITVTELCGGSRRASSRTVTTAVRFRELSDSEILTYIESGEPDGKAGAYAIQGLGSAFVSSVRGDYPNVVGISVFTLFDILSADFGVHLTEAHRRVLD